MCIFETSVVDLVLFSVAVWCSDSWLWCGCNQLGAVF